MKKAIVLGATGSMGNALVDTLSKRGIPTIAFGRSAQKLNDYKKEWDPSVEIMIGNAMNKEDIRAAVSKANIVFHSINIPYQDWHHSLAPMLLSILEECHIQKKSFVYVDNIYSYGRQNEKTTEIARKNPHTKKGKLRLQLLSEIEKSCVPYIIAHFPDFYGPKAGNTLLQYTFEQALKKSSAGFIGDLNIEREFIYVKDGAEALVELALREDAYGEAWNIPGADTITGKEIEEIVAQHLNRKIKLKTIPKWMVQALGLFNPFMREFVEMMYLNETPVILDGSKYEEKIGGMPKTPYETGIRETLKYMAEGL